MDVLLPLAEAHIANGDGDGAVRTAERALALVMHRALRAALEREARFVHARALWLRAGAGDRGRALRLAREARDRDSAAARRGEIDAWLAARSAGGR